jgi:hypothetical protein
MEANRGSLTRLGWVQTEETAEARIDRRAISSRRSLRSRRFLLRASEQQIEQRPMANRLGRWRRPRRKERRRGRPLPMRICHGRHLCRLSSGRERARRRAPKSDMLYRIEAKSRQVIGREHHRRASGGLQMTLMSYIRTVQALAVRQLHLISYCKQAIYTLGQPLASLLLDRPTTDV